MHGHTGVKSFWSLDRARDQKIETPARQVGYSRCNTETILKRLNVMMLLCGSCCYGLLCHVDMVLFSCWWYRKPFITFEFLIGSCYFVDIHVGYILFFYQLCRILYGVIFNINCNILVRTIKRNPF